MACALTRSRAEAQDVVAGIKEAYFADFGAWELLLHDETNMVVIHRITSLFTSMKLKVTTHLNYSKRS